MAQFADLAGTRRLVAGRTRYPSPVAPGTIVGGKDTTRELLVALTTDEDGATLFGYATPADLDAARARVAIDGPSSIAERTLPAAPMTVLRRS